MRRLASWASPPCLTLMAAAAFATAACRPERADGVALRIVPGAGPPLVAAAIRYEPMNNLLSARLAPSGWLVLERRDASLALTVRLPERCPVTLPPGPLAQQLDMLPVIELGTDRPPVGFDSRFEIRARHGCAEGGRGRISWRQVEGAPLGELSVSDDGFALSARTPRFTAVHPEPIPSGLVPISPRTQGRVVLEATWQGPGTESIVRTISIAATSRATGVPSVAVSQQLVLSGEAWRVLRAPQNGHARVFAQAGLSLFRPDAPGRWALESDRGEALTLQAFWHDKTPYDCGRSECHASIAEYTRQSPMSAALERQLTAQGPAAVGCMLDCHVLGERGLRDGGFLDVADQLEFSWLDSSGWQDLPQALRRLGGVRCTACHGPVAIPEPEARAKALSSDVCASCHDAPPRYVHVAQWRTSKMARSDAAEGTRSEPCAGCHTTSAFLATIRSADPSHAAAGSVSDAVGHAAVAGSMLAAGASEPLAAAAGPSHEPVGIACAACHAPHASHSGARLIRAVPRSALPAAIEEVLEPRSAVCVPCHSPRAGESLPSASSAALWLGRVRVPAAGGEGWDVISGTAAHRAVPGGCVGCHGGQAGSASQAGNVDHSFRVNARVCASCHAQSAPTERLDGAELDVQQRARELGRVLERACPELSQPPLAAPPHANMRPASCSDPAFARARYAVRLVLEDAAAASHDASLARNLLDDAEQQLSAFTGSAL